MRIIRFLVLALIAFTGVVIAVAMWRGECVGGTVVASEAACVAAGLAPDVCRMAFLRADDVARGAGPLYNERTPCEDRYPVCIEARPATGWVPRPAGFCIVPDRSGGVGRLTSVYRVREGGR
ncbi:DUF1190 domain-containing protein [Blastochloris sulfoviridis]|uniref:DUF1190 domain-containing protein n=1 Tax=Blastochloris sulfoviridis TaxID=50712 RepID=A0A5M6I0F9_9HYPH|nr:DUF1190 domain-containing protein [Blastochloris sulfoviridis]KAA5601662.1 DUF1190 domain-containing protein [Blastochloris sulfoviridis]